MNTRHCPSHYFGPFSYNFLLQFLTGKMGESFEKSGKDEIKMAAFTKGGHP